MAPITSKYSQEQAAVLAVQAGVDLILEPTDLEKAFNGVLDAVNRNKITESVIDDSVIRILTAKIRRGMEFE